MDKKTLNRTKQCKTCPWIKGNNPHDIPNGYCEIKHKNLKDTIADPNTSGLHQTSQTLKAMACHYSNDGNEQYCIGWLHNQLGVGNNISLRIRMMNYSNVKDIKIKGEQHENFEQTLPK